jgi:chromosomal replication initiation ATPase DnaA
MAAELCSYPFSSYSAFIGQVKAPNQILRKGAYKNTPRDVAIYLARELSGESGVDSGKYFGSICGAAVTGRYKQISEQLRRNRRLKGRVNRINSD